MKYQGVNHLAMVTNDMEKTVRFYRDVLGMDVVGTIGGEVGGEPMRHYFFSLGTGSCIAFFEWTDVELPASKPSGEPASGRQFDHVSIGVASEKDLLGLQKRARAAGVPASDLVDHGAMRSIYFEDPNGISLEFSVWMQDLEKEPMFKDQNLVPALQ
jgi:catechol 2,3-dioxygenase-like lactoylglutathione lyase family enzyme